MTSSGRQFLHISAHFHVCVSILRGMNWEIIQRGLFCELPLRYGACNYFHFCIMQRASNDSLRLRSTAS